MGFGADLPQDDAASGRDAPDAPDPGFGISPGAMYTGVLAPTSDATDHYAFPGTVGRMAQLALSGAPLCSAAILEPDGGVLVPPCNVGTTTRYTFTMTESGTYFLRVGTPAAAYRFSVSVGHAAPDPLLSNTAPVAPPTCSAAGVTQTSGERDGVVFAALKTGFRAVVAWTTEEAEMTSLSYTVNGGAPVTVSPASARTHHMFILDSLPVGGVLCFRTSHGVEDAFVLRNAMTDLRDGKYTVNMLLTAPLNLRGRAMLDQGMRIYAEKLYDATDGHVQPGRTIMVFSDPNRPGAGTYTCGLVQVVTQPPCDRRVDVTFSYDSCAQGAACAHLDGIQSPNLFIMMNSLFDANPVQPGLLGDANEVGSVLVHEFGHYAFGAQDLYVAGDCYDGTLSLSIMGSSRAVTEFDDDVHQCPNADDLPGYIPTWRLMRERFPAVPDRAGPIAEGPHGGGAAFVYTTFAVGPDVDGEVAELTTIRPEQNDAGSGGDAPVNPALAVPIEPGVLYEGRLLPTDIDTYRFETTAGQVFEAVLYTGTGCAAVTRASGGGIPGQSCELGDDGGQRVRGVSPGGTLLLRVTQATFDYRFGVGLDEPAPTWSVV